MSYYPESIASFREKQNLPGVVFNATNAKTLFAEDMQKLEGEVIAIEDTLGVNPQGEYATVAERLDAGGGGGGPLYEKKILPSGVNSIVFDTPVSMDELTYLKLQYIFPGRFSNNSVRLLFNNDTTPSNNKRTLEIVNSSSLEVSTSQSSNLGGMSTNGDTNNYTVTWQFELRKVPGKFLNVRGWSSTNGAAIDTGFRHLNLNYTGSAADITDIRFNVDSGSFPEGTVAILGGS